MNVQDIMKDAVSTCRPEDSLNTAAQIMWEHDCGCVPVLASDGCVVGMLTDRDVCMAAYTRGLPLAMLRVEDAMSRTVCACHPDDAVAQAEHIMRANQVHRLPVIDAGGRLVGLLSLNDVAQEAGHGPGRTKPPITLAEVGETLKAVCQPRRAQPSLVAA